MVIYIVSKRFEGDKRPYDRFVTYFQQTLRFFRVIFGLNHSNRVELWWFSNIGDIWRFRHLEYDSVIWITCMLKYTSTVDILKEGLLKWLIYNKISLK